MSHCLNKQCQQKLVQSSAISFRVPTVMVDVLLGVGNQRLSEIAYVTETEFELPHRFQFPIFTVKGYISNIFEALRIIEGIVNSECRLPQTLPYAFIPDPNSEQSGTNYILCNGPIREVRYKPEREGMRQG